MCLHVPYFNFFLIFFFSVPHLSFYFHLLYQPLSASLRYCLKDDLLQNAFSAPATLSRPGLLPHLADLLFALHVGVLLLVNWAASFRAGLRR